MRGGPDGGSHHSRPPLRRRGSYEPLESRSRRPAEDTCRDCGPRTRMAAIPQVAVRQLKRLAGSLRPRLCQKTRRSMPDFKTIANFRKGNGKVIRGVCRQIVVLCLLLGLFSDALVAIDGSKCVADL